MVCFIDLFVLFLNLCSDILSFSPTKKFGVTVIRISGLCFSQNNDAINLFFCFVFCESGCWRDTNLPTKVPSHVDYVCSKTHGMCKETANNLIYWYWNECEFHFAEKQYLLQHTKNNKQFFSKKQICQPNGVTERKQVEKMCEHLNSLGVLLWVNNPKTRDFVVLNPQLAIDAVSNVIGLYSHVRTARINAITDRKNYLTSGRLLLFVVDFVLFELLWPHTPKNKKAMNEHDSVFCLLTFKQDLPHKHSFMSCFRQLVWKQGFTNSSVNYFSALTFFVKWHLTKQMSVNLLFFVLFHFSFLFRFHFLIASFSWQKYTIKQSNSGSRDSIHYSKYVTFWRRFVWWFYWVQNSQSPNSTIWLLQWTTFTTRFILSRCLQVNQVEPIHFKIGKLLQWNDLHVSVVFCFCFVLLLRVVIFKFLEWSVSLFYFLVLSNFHTEFVLDQILFKWKWTQQTNSFPFSPIPNSQQTLFVWWVFFCTFYSCINLSFSKKQNKTNLNQVESFVKRVKIETFKNIKHATEVLIQVDQKQHAFGLDELLDGLANNQPFYVSISETPTKRQKKIPDDLVFGMCVLVVVFWLFCVLVVLCFGCCIFVVLCFLNTWFTIRNIHFPFLCFFFCDSDWKPPEVGKDTRFDVFISYRQSVSSNEAQFIGTCFGIIQPLKSTSKPPHVFLDTTSLVEGKQFDQSFCHALSNSTIFAPLISKKVVESVQVKLDKGELDHVLLEWTLALEVDNFFFCAFGLTVLIHFLLAILSFGTFCLYLTSFTNSVVFKGSFQFWKQRKISIWHFQLGLSVTKQITSAAKCWKLQQEKMLLSLTQLKKYFIAYCHFKQANLSTRTMLKKVPIGQFTTISQGTLPISGFFCCFCCWFGLVLEIICLNTCCEISFSFCFCSFIIFRFMSLHQLPKYNCMSLFCVLFRVWT